MTTNEVFDIVDEALKDGRDPHRLLAGFILNKPTDQVTTEERYRFKDAFYALFNLKVGELVGSAFKDLREINKLPAGHEWLRNSAKDKNGG